MIYFIEQYRNVQHPENTIKGKLMQTSEPAYLKYLEEFLNHTKKSETLKTIAVWIIKPKQQKP